MATAGDGVSTYQSGGAGGKFRKKPIRRSSQATPYDRPPTALRNNNNNNNPSFLAKLVDPASRLLYAGADRLFGVFRKRLPSLPAPRLPGTHEEPRNGPQEAVPNSATKNSTLVVEPITNKGGNLASISAALEISDLEDMLKQKTFTRSEIERLTALLHSKTAESNVVESNKAKLPSSSYHVQKTDPFTSGTLIKRVEEREIVNFDSTISTPVVNSRAFEDDVASPADLAKAYMGTRPTKLSPITLRSSSHAPSQDLSLLKNTTTFLKTPKTGVATKTFENGSTTTFRSRGRSALYNMPRTPYYRGPSTLSQKGVASPSAWEHEGSIGSSKMAAKRRSSALDDIGSGGPMRRIRQKANLSNLGSSQKLLLRNDPEPKTSKTVEETGETSKRNHDYGSVPTESSRMALKIFEHLDRLSPKEKPSGSKLAGITEKIDSPKELSSSQDKPKSEGKQQLTFSNARLTIQENSSRNINGSFTAPILTKAGSASKRAFSISAHEDSLELDDENHSNGHVSISLDENNKLGKPVGQTASLEFKKGAVSFSTSPVSKPDSIVDTVTPQNKSTVFPTFGTSSSNSAGPSGVKASISPDAKPPNSTSLVDSIMNKNQASFSASNKDDNLNTQKSVNLFGNSGSPSSAKLTTASTGGIFSFDASKNSSDLINGTSATTAFSHSATTATATTTSSAVINSFPTSIFNSASATSLTSASTAPTSPFSTTFATSSNGGSTCGPTNGFQASTQAASTSVTQPAPFKFGSGASGVPSSTSASSLFSSSAPSFGLTSAATSSEITPGGSTSNMFGYGSSSTPSFGLSSTPIATSDTKSGNSTPTMFGSGFSSAPSFGLGSTAATSDTNSVTSTTNMFGSGFSSTPSFGVASAAATSATPFTFGASSTSTPSASISPFVFGSSNANTVAAPPPSTGSSVFSFSSNPAPVFGASPTNNNDNMSMEDAMADDTNQTPTPTPTPSPQPFMFGSATPTTPATVQPPGFMFGAPANQQPPVASPNPFQAPQFNAGGSFSLGSGGDDKSSRRIVKVKRQVRRK